MAYFAPTPGAGTGATFTPGAGPKAPGRQINPQQSEALKVLSLRLPGTLGGRPIAPEGLLRPGPVGPQPGAVGQSLLGRMGGPPAGLPAPPQALPGAGPSAGPSQVQEFQAQGPTIPGGGGPSPFAGQGPDLSGFATLVASALGGGGSAGFGQAPNFTFQDPNVRALYQEGDANLPPPTLGPRPGQDTYSPPPFQPPAGQTDPFMDLVRGLLGGGDRNRQI